MGEAGIDRQRPTSHGEDDRSRHQDQPAVQGIADRSPDQSSGDERNQLSQAHGADLQRGPGHLVDLEGDGHGRELGAEHPDQLADEEEPEVATVP